jgi:hypothetical protein
MVEGVPSAVLHIYNSSVSLFRVFSSDRKGAVKDLLYGLMVRVPRYRTEMYCVSYEVRTEFM